MLYATKATVSLTMLNDARGQSLTYSRQLFQLRRRGRVDVDERLALRPVKSGGREILTGQTRRAPWQPDAGGLPCRQQPTQKDDLNKSSAPGSQILFHQRKPLIMKSLQKMPPKCAKC
jgi:hypothetical protein